MRNVHEMGLYLKVRHARACPGHPRLGGTSARKTWMAGTSPAMTKDFLLFGESLKMLGAFWIIQARVETLDHLNVPAHDAGEGR